MERGLSIELDTPEASSLCTSIELGELGSRTAHSVGWAGASIELGPSIELAALMRGVSWSLSLELGAA